MTVKDQSISGSLLLSYCSGRTNKARLKPVTLAIKIAKLGLPAGGTGNCATFPGPEVSCWQTMTFEDFKFKVRRNTNFDRYWYYGLCISIIAFCLFSSLFITIRPEKFKEFRALLYSLLLFFILLAAYGIYLLPNRYKIVTVDSKLTVDKKHNVIIRLLEEYKVSGNPGEQFYASFTLRRRFWHMPYDVYLFFDEQRFAFSIQPQDFLSGGFIDFGGAERKRNEIANRIMELSVEELPVANSALAEAGLTE